MPIIWPGDSVLVESSLRKSEGREMISYVVASKNEVRRSGHSSVSLRKILVQFCDFDEFVLAYRSSVEGGGVFLETHELLPVNEKIDIELSFTDSGRIFLKGEAQVIEHTPPSDAKGSGMLLRFLNLEEKSKTLLSKLSNQYL